MLYLIIAGYLVVGWLYSLLEWNLAYNYGGFSDLDILIFPWSITFSSNPNDHETGLLRLTGRRRNLYCIIMSFVWPIDMLLSLIGVAVLISFGLVGYAICSTTKFFLEEF